MNEIISQLLETWEKRKIYFDEEAQSASKTINFWTEAFYTGKASSLIDCIEQLKEILNTTKNEN